MRFSFFSNCFSHEENNSVGENEKNLFLEGEITNKKFSLPSNVFFPILQVNEAES